MSEAAPPRARWARMRRDKPQREMNIEGVSENTLTPQTGERVREGQGRTASSMLASRKSSSMRSARWSGCCEAGMLFQRPSNASTSACAFQRPPKLRCRVFQERNVRNEKPLSCHVSHFKSPLSSTHSQERNGCNGRSLSRHEMHLLRKHLDKLHVSLPTCRLTLCKEKRLCKWTTSLIDGSCS